MARWHYRAVALVAAYAIALQALLAGVVHPTTAGFDSSAVVCAHDYDHGLPPPQHGRDCSACGMPCGGASPGLIPPGAPVSSAIFPDRTEPHFLQVQALPPGPKHQRQPSRAPPSVA